MKKRIVLANAAINSGNKGCVALSYTAVFLIDKILSDKKIEYELFLSDSQHKEEGKHILLINGKQIVYHTISYPIGVDYKNNIIKLLFLYKTIKDFNTFRKVNYILDIGQGDSFSDIYGEHRFAIIDRVHKLARLLRKPYCLLPQTIGPFENKKIQKKAKKTLSEAKMVMARDKISCDYVKEYVPQQKNVDEYLDVAFFLPYERISFDENFIHVGLNVSGLLWNGGYTGKNEFGLKDDYQKIIRSIIDVFLNNKKVILHLIPHVVGQERNCENDYSISIDLIREYNHNRLVISPFFFTPIEAKSYISGLNFFMGARMHSAIAAYSSGVPVVPMSYSRKFNGLFGDTLNYKYYIDLKKEDCKSTISHISNWFDDINCLSCAIEGQNEIVVERQNRIMKSIQSFLEV